MRRARKLTELLLILQRESELISDFITEGGSEYIVLIFWAEDVSMWRCMHRASSYNMYINQQDAQNSCD